MTDEKEEIKIENMIYEIRGCQVMLDSDVAILFGYETKYLNRQVQRNIERFPENYCFKLNEDEYKSLRCHFDTLKVGRGEHKKYPPYVFTEYGITMLAGILKSKIAVITSLKIVDTFIAMRRYLSHDLLEIRYMNHMLLRHDNEIKLLQASFTKFEEKKKVNEIYFNGQIYDAYSKIIDIMKEAKESLILIDSYADKSVLDMISKVKIKVILITSTKTRLIELDIKKYQEQYNNLHLIYNNTFHDRYFIIDDKKIYHCGTSLNYAGSRTFSINILEDELVKDNLIQNIKQIIQEGE